MKNDKYDVIVIGAGVGGPAAGAILAKEEGMKVLVMEKASRVGGRDISFNLSDEDPESYNQLIGDAAHVVHPLAGQGLNIGLRDVAALTETIVDALRLGLDPGSATTLERYQRWRRFDSAFSGAVMDGLNRLFSNDSAPLRTLRDFGLGRVDRAPGLKRFLVREAAGETGDVPRLMRGEAL